MVAAAGNDSDRPHRRVPLHAPAKADGVLAVAAADRALQPANFSNVAPLQKPLFVAGPGVRVWSAWPRAQGAFGFMSGTSMACPHVAGIAALLKERQPSLFGRALADAVVRAASPLSAPREDVGAGLPRATS